jgi:phospholipase/lecithinase/hemolysin
MPRKNYLSLLSCLLQKRLPDLRLLGRQPFDSLANRSPGQPTGQRRRLGCSLETLESRQLLALVPLVPSAADDQYQVQEDQVLVGNIVAGTPAGGTDSSAKPTLPVQVIAVNGQPTVGGGTLALDSGATLEIAADGSFSYDPSTSQVLSALPTGDSAVDSFAYTLAPEFSNVFVFGDSLSDQGQLFAATGGLFPPFPYFEGRISNGPVWIESLAPRLGLSTTLANNFAVAGAATSDANYNELILGTDLPGLSDQLNYFLQGLGGQPADPEALYVVWAGANDFFLPFDPTRPDLVITEAVTNLATTVATLHAVGAQHIAVLNLSDMGLTPYALATGQSAGFTALSAGFNGALAGTLSQLGAPVTLVDLFTTSQQIAADPAAYGLSNVTHPVFDGAAIVGNPDEYLYWDSVHPTAAGHRLIADAVLDAFADEAAVAITVADDTTPPELIVESRPGAAPGELVLHLSAQDPSAADQEGTFLYSIDWGNSQPPEVVAGPASGLVVEHTYASGAIQQIVVTAIDQDGDSSDPFNAVVVWGTTRNDILEVTAHGGDELRVYASRRLVAQLDATAVDRVVMFGLRGNDLIYASDLAIPVELDGGAGNDQLFGGQASDILRGAAGNDTLWGLAGDDWLFGDEGNDKLRGGLGEDRLDGGAGNDSLFGDSGDDWLFGTAGKDSLTGGAGDDWLELVPTRAKRKR